jgi:DNA-binding NtrC family response regulator
MAKTILIVDDEPTQVRIIETAVTRHGYQTLSADGGAAAIKILLGKAGETVDVVLLDLAMPEVSGIDVLERLRPLRPDLPVIVLTAHSSVNNVVEAMRAGASDFISKPASAERLRSAVESALNAESAVGEIEPVRQTFVDELDFDDLAGASPATAEAVDMARKAARTSMPVLIEGESGVGKELFARAIQAASERAKKPFVTVNCGAIPENLVESILFGHEKGSFTGADGKHIGKFQEADGGTLFLDEIGELPLDIQVKLLRAIQEGEIDPVGARKPVQVDIRIISATNRELAEQVAQGSFREDLYYRLNVLPLHVPALRQRREDIPQLVEHFIERVVDSEKLETRTIDQEAMTLLVNHSWAGNIRQLQNAVFRAVVLCEETRLAPEDFPQILAHARRRALGAASEGGATEHPAMASKPGDHPAETGSSASHGLIGEAYAPIDPLTSGQLAGLGIDGHMKRLAEIEKQAIQLAIRKYDGRMSEVARRLGIGRSTLYRKMAEYKLRDDNGSNGSDSDIDSGGNQISA